MSRMRQQVDQAGGVPALAAAAVEPGRRTGRPGRSREAARRCARASSRQMPRSLRIQSTAKPKSNLPRPWSCSGSPSARTGPRPWRSPRAPASASRPACMREVQAFGQALDQAGDADLVDHLGQLAGAGRADQRRTLWRRRSITGLAAAKSPASPPHMTVSCAVLRARLAAGDRRVEEADARAAAPLRPARARRRRRRWCGRRRSRPWPCRRRHRPARRDAAHVVVVADARRTRCRPRARPRPAWRQLPAVRLCPCLRLGRRCGCRPSPRGRPSSGGPPSGSP